jgi:CBS domain-containing protein
MTLKGILKEKPAAVISVTTETTISDVVDVLAEKRIGAVLVLDEAGEMRGILSERDIVRNLAKHESATLTLLAKDLMTPNPTTASPAATVADAMEIMTDGRFRHLPVVENGKLIGLVSIGDVVKARLSQQEHEVDSLRAYVSGGV